MSSRLDPISLLAGFINKIFCHNEYHCVLVRMGLNDELKLVSSQTAFDQKVGKLSDPKNIRSSSSRKIPKDKQFIIGVEFYSRRG